MPANSNGSTTTFTIDSGVTLTNNHIILNNVISL